MTYLSLVLHGSCASAISLYQKCNLVTLANWLVHDRFRSFVDAIHCESVRMIALHNKPQFVAVCLLGAK